MEGPLSVIFEFNYYTELIIAVGIGILFGFFLERAGFGNANNLISIFYGRDFRVLRVMFTAVITSATGVYLLDLFGILPIYSIGILDTYLWSQMAGGIILGFGFIIGGYCPGTSVVASVSGKADAIIFIGGLIAGSAIFSISYDQSLLTIHKKGHMGRILLSEYLGIPAAILLPLIVVVAIGAFSGVKHIEDRVNKGA